MANQDLKIASLRMHEAQAVYNIQRAELFPNIGGTASMERSHVPADLSYVGREVTSVSILWSWHEPMGAGFVGSYPQLE